jgi:NADPH2:quinone reductase
VRPQRPFAPGAEVAGVVDAVGEGVTSLALGQRVTAAPSYGGFSELLLMAADRCQRVPDGVSDEVAACVQLTYGTSWYGLMDCAVLVAGETVLILGAAGGIGLAAIDIAKARGARVVAAVSTEEKARIARFAGADETVIYGTEPLDAEASRRLAARFKDATGGGADVIVDPVGGPYADPALRAIRPRGRYLVVGFTAGIPQFAGNLILLKDARLIGVPWGALVALDLPAYTRTMNGLLRDLDEGRLHPMISERLPFERAPEALERLRTRGAVGKIVILRCSAGRYGLGGDVQRVAAGQ